MVNCSDQRKAKMYHCTDRLNKPVLHFSPICCPFYRHSLADVTSPLQVFLAKCCGHWLSLSRNAMVWFKYHCLSILNTEMQTDRQTDRQRDRQTENRQTASTLVLYKNTISFIATTAFFFFVFGRHCQPVHITSNTCHTQPACSPHHRLSDHQQHMPHTTSMLTSSSPVRQHDVQWEWVIHRQRILTFLDFLLPAICIS